jgi:hypothetical protein
MWLDKRRCKDFGQIEQGNGQGAERKKTTTINEMCGTQKSVKQSHYRPLQALSVRGGSGSMTIGT